MIGRGYYILDGHRPVRVDSVLVWAQWLETADRHVAVTEGDGWRVSTVFLGLDHNFGNFGSGAPLLFETMIFGGPHNEECWRYCTWAEAHAGHTVAVKLALASAQGARRIDLDEEPTL